MSLGACLAHLETAIDAAEQLGLDASAARSTLETARTRLGFTGSAYVLALVGGTGVGKSTLLNALAHESVTEIGVRRPTTNEPVAWLSHEARADAVGLLEWLGAREIREHDRPAFRNVAILDLPDIDSTSREHSAKVDELLPRVDAIVWVTDPEKYRDAILHNAYVRSWSARLPRQLVVLNKADRIGEDAARVRQHLASTFRDEGRADVRVAVTNARGGEVSEVRDWIADGVEAKRVIAARFAADVRAAAAELAARAGVRGQAVPIVSAERRTRALVDTAREALAIADLKGVERQAIAATRLAARPSGAGPLGPVTAALYKAMGRERAAADPDGYLRRWRERGSASRAGDPIRRLIRDVVPLVPPETRARVAGTSDGLDDRVGQAIDDAVAGSTVDRGKPRSRLWNLIGALQYVVTAGLLFSGLWLVTIVMVHPPVGTVDLPLLGPVPTPLVLLSLLLLAGYLLARLLGLDAARRGRAWARRIVVDVGRQLEARLEDVFAPLAAIDAARGRLFEATREIEDECGADVDVSRKRGAG